jgi:hypothetical protein
VHHTTPVAVSGRRNSVASLSYSMLFGTSQGGCVGDSAVHVGCFVLSVPTQVVCRQFEPIVPPDSNVLDKAATTCSQSGGEILSDAGCIKRPRRHDTKRRMPKTLISTASESARTPSTYRERFASTRVRMRWQLR